LSVNCATLRGDAVNSALFGHKKGSFTGATSDRPGLLREADDGLLFLDEIGELGVEEQAMLLNAIETKHFLPLGSDHEVCSDFQLIAGTNRDLWTMVDEGTFREDLIARLDVWAYHLPSLKDRIEDLEPNLDFEIDKARERLGTMIRFSREARERYVRFATEEAEWRANFRDLNSSVTRMATLADGGRISLDVVTNEIALLRRRWDRKRVASPLDSVLPAGTADELDLFDRVQLEAVIEVCRASRSLAEAGRKLFQASRLKKTSRNDSHRVRQYLERFNLTFDGIRVDSQRTTSR
jgi:transcriptional regulatory protein RtcR